MTTKNLMIQGTASAVGKSIVVTGLCRIFRQDGFRVAPFKAQNMALNSFVTIEGLEMGRAQAVQAEASGIEPSVLMNPILLKPTREAVAQVIVNGRVLSNIAAKDYQNYKNEARAVIAGAYATLAESYELIIIEGAGSPAEINLKDNDLVNMGMAAMANAPVLLVADIDKGGVFASIVGTLFLLTTEEQQRVKGIIINKFRGDLELLRPGIEQLEKIIQKPVIGVIPYMRLAIEDEDSVTEQFAMENPEGDLTIVVIKLPCLSNFTDFEVFRLFKDVNLVYAETKSQLASAAIIILPGTKNTIEDLKYIKNNGFENAIIAASKQGAIIIGVCGGLQMLGKIVNDPYAVESETHSIDGIGLLDINTLMANEKVTRQVKGIITTNEGLMSGLAGQILAGYEIHMGNSHGNDMDCVFMSSENGIPGIMKDRIIGTYMHGMFDNTVFTRKLLNNVRRQRGLQPVEAELDYKTAKELAFDELAHLLRKHLDMDLIYKIIDT